MKISSFKYILTNIGGGWGTIYQFYGVTPTGDVYSTKKFDYRNLSLDTDIECKFVGHLDNIELKLPEKVSYAVMDASDLTVYEVGDTLKIVHNAPEIEWNNPQLFHDIQRLERETRDREVQEIVNSGNFIVGEVKTPEEFKRTMHLLNSGYPICTTHHARLDEDVVDKIKELMEIGEKASN